VNIGHRRVGGRVLASTRQELATRGATGVIRLASPGTSEGDLWAVGRRGWVLHWPE